MQYLSPIFKDTLFNFVSSPCIETITNNENIEAIPKAEHRAIELSSLSQILSTPVSTALFFSFSFQRVLVEPSKFNIIAMHLKVPKKETTFQCTHYTKDETGKQRALH